MFTLTDPFYLTLFWAGIGLVGLCLGSMATALIHRLPRDLSFAGTSRSYCPTCHTQLKFYDLIPVLSFLSTCGKCRYCRAPIGWQYPAVEISTMGLCFLAAFLFGADLMTVVMCLLAPVLVAMLVIDIQHKIIPDQLNIAVAVLGVCALFVTSLKTSNPPEAIIDKLAWSAGGAFLYAGMMWVLRFAVSKGLKKEALGLGDIKLFAAIGVWMGAGITFPTFMMITGIAGVAFALLWKAIAKEEDFPFGPAILLAFAYFLYTKQAMVFVI